LANNQPSEFQVKDSKTAPVHWMNLVIPGGDPLSRQERDRLDKIFNTHSGQNGHTSYAVLDGFLTALLVGPVAVPRASNQGFDTIWRDSTSAAPLNSRSEKVRQLMMNALGRHAGHMQGRIQSARDKYQPYAGQDSIDWADIEDLDDNDSGSDCYNLDFCKPLVVEWCEGFMKYVALSPESWAPILKSEASRSNMAPFIYFGTKAGWDGRKELESGLRPYRLHFAKHLKYFVFDVSDFFRPPLWKVEMSSLLKLVEPEWITPTKPKQIK
jgi:yecA family protein